MLSSLEHECRSLWFSERGKRGMSGAEGLVSEQFQDGYLVS